MTHIRVASNAPESLLGVHGARSPPSVGSSDAVKTARPVRRSGDWKRSHGEE